MTFIGAFAIFASANPVDRRDLSPNPIIFHHDPLLGVRITPNVEVKSVEGDIRYSINSSGYRDREIEFSKPTVLVLGNSNTMGYGIDAESRWTNLLQQEYPQWNIFNLSLQATSVEEMLMQARELEKTILPRAKKMIVALQPMVPEHRYCHLFDDEQWGRKKVRLERGEEGLIVHPSIPPVVGHVLLKHRNTSWLPEPVSDILVNAYRELKCTAKYTFYKREYWALARAIIRDFKAIGDRNNVDVLFISEEDEVSKLLQALNYPTVNVFLKNRRKYQVNQRIGHVNVEGQKIFRDEIKSFIDAQQWL